MILLIQELKKVKKDKKENSEGNNIQQNKAQSNKKVLLIGSIAVVLLIIVFIGISYGNNKSKADYTNNNSQNNQMDTQESQKDKYQIATYHIDISPNEIFTKKQEDKYINYARKTKVDETNTYMYEIKDNKVYATKKEDNSILIVNINDETPKYLEAGADCGGEYVYILTKEGNIYGSRTFDPTTIKIIYNQKNAEEMVRINESKIFTTCGEVSIYALANRKLYHTYYSSVIDNLQNYESREEFHPFSIAYSLGQDDDDMSKVLIYPDGKLNKYIYDYRTYEKVKNEFVRNSSGENIHVSFMYNLDKKLYIIDTNGFVYNISTLKNNDNTELTEFSLINIYEGKRVNYIELEVEYLKNKYRFYDNIYYLNPKMTLVFDDNTKQEYSSNLSFDMNYINK